MTGTEEDPPIRPQAQDTGEPAQPQPELEPQGGQSESSQRVPGALNREIDTLVTIVTALRSQAAQAASGFEKAQQVEKEPVADRLALLAQELSEVETANILLRLQEGIAREQQAMDALLSRLRTTRIAA